MNKIGTNIEGVYIIESTIYSDKRGYFFEPYNYIKFCNLGIKDIFVQDNQSVSRKNVLRGLHFQKKYPQSKLIRVLHGEIFDVVVDLRDESPTFGKWFSIILTSENNKQLYIPKGLAHGFLALTDDTKIQYKVNDYYHPNDEGGIIWDDKDINIQWPIDENDVILSLKDNKAMSLKEYVQLKGLRLYD